MPPYMPDRLLPRDPPSQVRKQWSHPSDILSLLLIVGPDVIQRALAQLAGTSVTPLVFSFGWVAYAVSAIASALGGKPKMRVSLLL